MQLCLDHALILPMTVDYSIETARKILDGPLNYSTNNPSARTPLHVNFSALGDAPSEQIINYEQHGDKSVYDPKHFNAIGSKIVYANEHKPVLDVDGGARLQNSLRGSKLILSTAYGGSYTPDSSLRDVLGDNDIDLEVFTHPTFDYNSFTKNSNYKKMSVGAIVLRSTRGSIFEVFDSTQKGHSHVYIQQKFSASDHQELIKELGTVGVIGPDWQKIVEKEGMGVLRTPWTTKPIREKSS